MLHARAGPGPGTFPSGGPEPEVGNIWKVGAPAIDIRGPDLYSPNQPEWIKWYRANDTENPLFIPETDNTRGAYHLFYALGQYDAMGYAPFAIDELLHPPASGTEGWNRRTCRWRRAMPSPGNSLP